MSAPCQIPVLSHPDNLLQYTEENVNVYVAPDAGSALPGDYVGPTGIYEAAAYLSTFSFQQGSYGTIYLRDGVYSMAGPLQLTGLGSPDVRIRGLSTPTGGDPALVYTGVKLDDEATFRSRFPVIIETPSSGVQVRYGEVLKGVTNIGFVKTGASGGQGLYVYDQAYALVSNCGFFNFKYGVYQNNRSVVISKGQFEVLHSSNAGVYLSDSCMFEGSSSGNRWLAVMWGASNACLGYYNCLLKLFGRMAIEHNAGIGVYGSTGTVLRVSGSSSYVGDCRIKYNSSRGVYLTASSVAYLTLTFLDNIGRAVEVIRGSSVRMNTCTLPAAGPTAARTIRANLMGQISVSGISGAAVYSPALGVEGNANSRIN